MADHLAHRGRRRNSKLRRIRYEFERRFLPQRDITVDTLNGRLTFSSKDGVIGKHLFAESAWAWPMMSSVEKLLVDEGLIAAQRNDMLINVGANIGTVLVPLLKSGLFDRAIGFEPEPNNAAYLRHNIAQNGLDSSARVFEIGLSDEAATATLALSSGNFGDHRVRSATGTLMATGAFGESGRDHVQVPLARLDELLEDEEIEPGAGSVLWVDIQGHEGHFLRGAERALAQKLPLVMELWPYGLRLAGTTAEALSSQLRESFEAFYVEDHHGWERRAVSRLPELMATLDGPRSSTDLILVGSR